MIRILYISFPFIALLAGLYAFKFLDKPLKMILFYVSIGFCSEFFLWLLVKSGLRNTMPGLHFYVMFEFLIWSTFYKSQLKDFVKTHYLLLLIILFQVYCVINMIFIQKLTEYPFTRSVENLFLLLLAVIFYIKIMLDAKVLKLFSAPLIWINSSVFIYFAGNFFYNIVANYLLKVNVEFMKMISMYIFTSFNILFYSGIAIGFILQRVNYSENERISNI